MTILKVSFLLLIFSTPLNSIGNIKVEAAVPTCSMAKKILELLPEERESVLKKSDENNIPYNTIIVYELSGLEALEQITMKWAKENNCFINA